MDTSLNSEPAQAEQGRAEPKAKPLWLRLSSKGIWLAVLVAVALTISGLRGSKRDKFIEELRAKATAACNQDQACLQRLAARFDTCIEAHLQSSKSGKYNRNYSVDEEQFPACLKAD